jgi:hypothetical protein
MGRLHLARIPVFPYVAGLRKGVIALGGLRGRVGFPGLSLKFVECLLGDGKFIHKKSNRLPGWMVVWAGDEHPAS